jgi:hypothetical protein
MLPQRRDARVGKPDDPFGAVGLDGAEGELAAEPLPTTTTTTGGWNATVNYVVGRAKWAGANANSWIGGIDDVRIYG